MMKSLLSKSVFAAAGTIFVMAPLFAGCAADSPDQDTSTLDDDVTIDDGKDDLGPEGETPDELDTFTTDESALDEAVAVGEKLAATSDLNLRSGPSANDSILEVVPEDADVTVESAAPSGGWYQIKFGEKTGWGSGMFLSKHTSGNAPDVPEEQDANDSLDVDSFDSSALDSVSPLAAGGTNAVKRAQEWVKAKVPYCGGTNGGHDYICGGTCRRPHNKWDKYRSDCSGIVSWSWGLKAPGLTTYGFAPYSSKKSYVIKPSKLAPGDALNNKSHIFLFAGWSNKSKGLATIIQESGCGKVAQKVRTTLKVTGSKKDRFVSSRSGKVFFPIRKR
ncbi:SH3 domain-containing protein [Pendulispora brunnea]|uniref:SH3 domain-containing protein n=1 Tax=Pendulispora brunnea TaxID=2905690 RepID=A0ABZ2KD99_9BACT